MSNSIKNINQIFSEEHWKRKEFQKDTAFFPNERESAALAVDGNSLIRNSMNVASSFAKLPAATGSFINSSCVFGGMLGVPLGLSSMYDSINRGKAAYDYSDTEGVAQNILSGTMGASYTAISTLMGVGGVLGLMEKAVPATLSPAISGLGLVMSGTILASSGYGIGVTTQFRNEFKKIQKEKDAKAVLQFLKDQVSLNPEETKDLSEKKIAKTLQKKWNYFERKVGVSCANQVREKLPELLTSFDAQKANELIFEVEKANFKERVKHIMLFAVAIISAVAFVLTFFTTGAISSILFAVGAAVWLAIDSSSLHNFIGEKCWAWHSGNKRPEECPIPLTN